MKAGSIILFFGAVGLGLLSTVFGVLSYLYCWGGADAIWHIEQRLKEMFMLFTIVTQRQLIHMIEKQKEVETKKTSNICTNHCNALK